jgi:hypothetical protein
VNPITLNGVYRTGWLDGYAWQVARDIRATTAARRAWQRNRDRIARDATDEFVVECVLRWINAISPEGAPVLYDLPTGIPGDATYCPIAQALALVFESDYNVSVSGDTTVDVNGRQIDAPACQAVFVNRFDSGRFPAYDSSESDHDNGWDDDVYDPMED